MITRVIALTCLGTVVPLAAPADAQSLREVFRKASPSVVIVYAEQKAVATPLAPPVAQPQPQQLPLIQGAGVLIVADGKVLTAAHVVQFASRIEVEFANATRASARVVASAPLADLALLQVASVPPGAQPASLGDSSVLDVGDQVFAIGTPHGLSHSLAVGWVSARRSGNAFENLMALEVLQIDMAVYEGNSGGPIFNLTGEVVGIVSHVLLQLGAGSGPGFAVASNVARRLMLESGTVWFGVETYLIEGPLAGLFNVPQPAGLLVQSVATDSLAAQLGLRDGQLRIEVEGQPLIAGGDIVLEMLGHQVSPTSLQVIEAALAQLRPGDPVSLKALRGGQVIELTSRIPQ